MGIKTNVTAVILCLMAIYWYQSRTKDTGTVRSRLDTHYDYIIVGGGTAGCVLANRLSEDSDVTVLLLEAGDEETSMPSIALPYMGLTQRGSSADWNFKSVPQKQSFQGHIENRESIPRGKILGGSSSISAMHYNRGSRHDFDLWAEMGCEGWSFQEVLPYYVKCENNHNENLRQSGHHGHSGPLHVSDNYHPMIDTFMQAAEQLGHKQTDRHNDGDEEGALWIQTTTHKGTRSSAATAYLRPAMTRDNLHVAVLTHVTQVLIEGKKAIGVEFIRNGTIQQVFTRREVILSGGTFSSPQILMLSGIGPKAHLESLQIPLRADLPVGKGLQDHQTTEAVPIEFDHKVTVTKGERQTLWAKFQYLLGEGPIALFDSVGNVFVKAPSQPMGHKYPYLLLLLGGFGIGEGGETIYNATRDIFLADPMIFNSLFGGIQEGHTATFLIILQHPGKPGSVKLMSTNPLDPPLIDPNNLGDPQDIKLLIEGIREAQKFVNTTAFQSLGAKLLKRHHPSCKEHEYDSDAYWDCYLRNGFYGNIHHPVGTCKMGPEGDPQAVVDPQLRVHGIPNLRVIDASIMPVITSAPPLGSVFMIAEKGADMIKKG